MVLERAEKKSRALVCEVKSWSLGISRKPGFQFCKVGFIDLLVSFPRTLLDSAVGKMVSQRWVWFVLKLAMFYHFLYPG